MHAVNHYYFVMKPSAEVKFIALEKWLEPANVNTGIFPAVDKIARQFLGSVRVKQHVNFYSALCCRDECLSNRFPGGIRIENIKLKMNAFLRVTDQLFQQREIFASAFDQCRLVAGCILGPVTFSA